MAVCDIAMRTGCPYDIADENGMLALHEAASQGHRECVAILLEAGTVLDVADLSGAMALHWAALDGHTEICQQLIMAGAAIEAVDNGDPPQTAFHFALHGGHNACAAFLGKVYYFHGTSCLHCVLSRWCAIS